MKMWLKRALLAFLRDEIDLIVTKRLLAFHTTLIAREQIKPPQRFVSGENLIERYERSVEANRPQ